MNFLSNRTQRMIARTATIAAITSALAFAGNTSLQTAQAADSALNVSALGQLAESVSQGGYAFEAAEKAAAQAGSTAAQADAWNQQMRAAEAAAITASASGNDSGTITDDESGWIGATITGNNVPLAGVKVVLDGPTKAITHTDANGKYSFPQVIPGAYKAWVTLPDGFTYNNSAVVATSTTLGFAGLDRSMGFNAVR